MPLVEWTDNLSVGMPEFDSHHRRLIELINNLHDSLDIQDGTAVARDVLAELTNYTMYHFFAEEDVLQRFKYPGYPDHKKEHLYLTERTLGFLDDLCRGEAGLSQKVLEFLKEWLCHHIMETDRKYTPFLKAQGIC